MREIFYKAKRIDIGEWVEGFYLKRYDFLGKEEHLILRVNSYRTWEYVKVFSETICQFTGLCDKYGNKIWENDIVKTVSDIYAHIKFGLYTTGFALEECNQGFYVDFPNKSYLRHELGYWNNKVEVRGNIFDNPKLLQEVRWVNQYWWLIHQKIVYIVHY